ncbi:MAG: hypothetical protein U9O18_09865 [Chloroflexota bacterium]|nr:hypothetical protein [Chloroflexota bacterium]
MTREQDLERRVADWLTDGPVTAPTEAVDEAIERTVGRRQHHPLWGRLLEPLDQLRANDETRVVVLIVVLALTLLAALAIAVPFAGGPRPAPEMSPTSVLEITGTTEVISESEVDGVFERAVRVVASDPRASGEARQIVHIEEAPGVGLQRSTGVMRLENEWGVWEGVVHGARYPDGSELEYGWLEGEDTYAGFSYFHSTRGQSTGAERAVEGAIWPGEPPPMPDPSLLP